MGLLYPGLPIAICIAVFGLLGRHAVEMKGKKNYREMWGAFSLSVLPAVLFLLWAGSGESSVVARNLILMPAGAILGACALAWAGYVWNDYATARAQPIQTAQTSREPIAAALEALADAIAKARGVSAGVVGIGTNGGTGVVGIGNGPGSVGVAGIANGTPVNDMRATALRQAAQRVRVGAATKSQLRELILQNFVFFDPAVRAAMDRATASLDRSDLAN
jgi:hypothetical protein